MSNAGFRVRGTHGIIQVDQDFRNLALISKPVVNCGTRLGNSHWIGDIDIGGVNPIIAFASGLFCAVMSRTPIAANVVRYRIAIQSSQPANVQLYVYDLTPNGNYDSYGLVINDAAGNKVFDSSFGYMKVVDALQLIEAPGSQDAQINKGYAAGRSYAVAMASPALFSRVAVVQVGPGVFQYNFAFGLAMAVFQGSNIAVRTSVYNSGGGSGQAPSGLANVFCTCYMLILDITGY